ncbi:hypothetical protein MRX96_059363 [Rhipicephalus microplus]|uniref:Uncharacterized protein n=1 Tax=Rhipicephalus microplus TaxID=6941 RepID=A0A9J6EHY0_RHIMP|nr:hypothetical protein HPB51_014921 [Rhipicephalus microplus]
MSIIHAYIRARQRKYLVRAKPSTGSANSSVGDSLPTREVDFAELFRYPERHSRFHDALATTEGAAASERTSSDEIPWNQEKMGSHEVDVELTSHDIPAVASSEEEDNSGPFAEEVTIFNSEIEDSVARKLQLKTPTDSEAADIEDQLRNLLRSFELQRTRYCSFVQNEDHDEEQPDFGVSSNIQNEADAGGSSSASDTGEHMVSGDLELRRARSSSSRSSCCKAAVEEQNEDKGDVVKSLACQVPSSACCHSGDVKGVPSESERETVKLDVFRFTELKSTPRSNNVDVTVIKEGRENLRWNQVGGVQQLQSDQVLRSPQVATTQTPVQLKICAASKEQNPADKNKARAEASPPQPRLPLRERNAPPPLRPEKKLLNPRVEQGLCPRKQADEQFSTVAKPMTEPHKVSDWKNPALASTDFERQLSNQGQIVVSNTKKQLSKIVRYAKKRHPELSEQEIRAKIDRLRRSRDGLSGLTFAAIVELLFEKPEAEPKDKP